MKMSAALILGASLAIVSLAHAQAPASSAAAITPTARYEGPLAVQKVNDRIYLVRGPSTSNNSNNGIIIGRSSVLLFDTKNTRQDERDLLSELAKLTDKPVRTVFISHSDGDHINGLPVLPKGVAIYAQEYAARVMKDAAAQGGERAPDANYLPTKTFKTREILTIDGVKIQLLNYGAGHIGGDLIAYLPDDKVVFMGDIVISEIAEPFMHMDNGGSPTGIIRAIKAMIALDADTYISGHGGPVTKADLQTRLAVYEDKAAKVLAMVKERKTLEEIKAALGETAAPAPGGRGPRAGLTDYLYQEATRAPN